ncbi:Zn(2)-C6 fungal-type DNA-binding domain protein [Kalmanozyma brasiliensis GHG001]|uniref:Zn(2)-C6 fungal-type domain-containing protein n=1 Tax=Kalmanozyma brasiliensis (strain GHG001) TaxID=1365824 RepID=V5E3W2_KALBG|nr:Zn(2)-C6 fungal-type DNA-binding domain protein [Kalmanozyma brasiliensis GHG001]EST04871.1 Zn(2)-C6 fungal-type DNA-binding domain protein [Kalmanozyma brasiliensis GHG001]
MSAIEPRPPVASTSAPPATSAGPSTTVSGSNATSSPKESNEDDPDKPKRTQTCFRCRQSKVKCVFEDNASSCRRCLRLGVSCELQGKKEPLSWQMRVQHQLAALEGSLQNFLEKQGTLSPMDARDKRSSFPRSRDSPGGSRPDHDGGSKKRRRTIASDQRTSSDPSGVGYAGHAHTAGESPIYAELNSGSTSSYPSTTHFSPRDMDRNAHHSSGLLSSLVASTNGAYGSPSRSRITDMEPPGSTGGPLVAHADSGSIAAASASLHDDHAMADDDGAPASAERGPFQTDDENDQASRPLSAIQKLRMSVLDRKKELSRSGERVFPNLYRMATSDVGSKDPRPNVIKQDLVSPSDAVVLFRFFAEYLDQYSFGFPTYRPDAIMSPMILTSVVCVASLHHAQLNRLHAPLKNDLIARLQTDDPSFPCSDVYETLFSSSAYRSSHLQSNLHFEKELDPELGIGVEEIVGASLFASWFGGKRAWMASRLARWWSAKFLRQQQHPAMMTMGEIMSILPPPRDLGKQDLLRVWLSAYITEIHQACMEGTPSIAGLSSPHAVCDSLQYSKGLSQRTTLRDRVLIIHSRIAWIVSKAYHIAGSGSADWSKEKQTNSKASPARNCQSCRDGAAGETSAAGVGPGTDAASRLRAILGAFEELDSCQEEMAGRLDADAIGESESMLYLDLFLARVLIASIGCDFLDSTLWDGSLGESSAYSRGSNRDKTPEADLQSLRSRTLRESLTRGVDGALRSLELICLPGSTGAGGSGPDGRIWNEVSLNILVLPLWFHWALTRSVLFLMNVLAEYPERLLPRDRSRSVELINMFLDLYGKHIGHANMVLSHASGHHRGINSDAGGYGGPAWSPSEADGRDHRHSGTGENGGDATAGWRPAGSGTAQEIQHPATPLLDTLSQCQTWARHGGVM